MPDNKKTGPDNTAERVALWRALHVQVDAFPYILEDEIGLKLLAPDSSWRQRPDMDPEATKFFRASILARSRFIEDLVAEHAGKDIRQYVILGAGLDTFAQRRHDLTGSQNVFEVERPDTQAWKRGRLIELGFGIPEWLHLVPADFEAGESWLKKLNENGFNSDAPAIFASTGVSMYLTKEAISAMLNEISMLAPGTILAMEFLLPMESAKPEERAGNKTAEKGAKASGNPFISFFTPSEMLELARKSGFKEVSYVSAKDLTGRYFAGRADGLKPGSSQAILIAAT